VILDYLQGAERADPDCPQIIESAERGETEIVVSVLAEAEVAKIDGTDEDEKKIREFFQRNYIIRVGVDPSVTEAARRLIREHGLRAADAIHLATAIVRNVAIMETQDDRILAVGDKEGLVIRKPIYEGQLNLEGSSG
jgi:predicted nucleic acid-binding protein